MSCIVLKAGNAVVIAKRVCWEIEIYALEVTCQIHIQFHNSFQCDNTRELKKEKK